MVKFVHWMVHVSLILKRYLVQAIKIAILVNIAMLMEIIANLIVPQMLIVKMVNFVHQMVLVNTLRTLNFQVIILNQSIQLQ